MVEKIKHKSISNDKILDWSKLKVFAFANLNVINPLPDDKFQTLPN